MAGDPRDERHPQDADEESAADALPHAHHDEHQPAQRTEASMSTMPYAAHSTCGNSQISQHVAAEIMSHPLMPSQTVADSMRLRTAQQSREQHEMQAVCPGKHAQTVVAVLHS